LPSPLVLQVFERLIEQERIVLLGACRQELLSGIRRPEQFRKLRVRLRAFAPLSTKQRDYELAAAFFNRCAKKGIQGSNTDFLICAVAVRRRLLIYTADHDFREFAKVLPIRFYDPPKELD
jgi:predicted nucleic acid-binding protein